MSGVGKNPPASEITPEALYLRRREFMRNAVLFTATSATVGSGLLWLMRGGRAEPKPPGPGGTGPGEPELTIARPSHYSTEEPRTPYRDVTGYNNFYEFGTGKGDPAENARTLRPRPWTVAVEGEVHKPQVVDVDQLLR